MEIDSLEIIVRCVNELSSVHTPSIYIIAYLCIIFFLSLPFVVFYGPPIRFLLIHLTFNYTCIHLNLIQARSSHINHSFFPPSLARARCVYIGMRVILFLLHLALASVRCLFWLIVEQLYPISECFMCVFVLYMPFCVQRRLFSMKCAKRCISIFYNITEIRSSLLPLGGRSIPTLYTLCTLFCIRDRHKMGFDFFCSAQNRMCENLIYAEVGIDQVLVV